MAAPLYPHRTLLRVLCVAFCSIFLVPAIGSDLKDAEERDGVWITDAVKEEQPLDGVRIFTVTHSGRYRVLVASVDESTNALVLDHLANCETAHWRPMHSFTTDETRAPAAYGCMHPRELADAMLESFNSDATLAHAMRLAFNVSVACTHREGKTDPKLGGSWLRNHILYHVHPRFRGTRAWTALLNEETTADAFHADGFERLRREPGTDFFTVLRYPNDGSWRDGWGGEFLIAPHAQMVGSDQRAESEALIGTEGAVMRIAPRPDRIIVFSGQLLHRSTPPTHAWPIVQTPPGLAAASLGVPDGGASASRRVPKAARWRVASVMQLTCRNDAYHGPFEGPPPMPNMAPRLLGLSATLILVAIARGDVSWGRGARREDEPPTSPRGSGGGAGEGGGRAERARQRADARVARRQR